MILTMSRYMAAMRSRASEEGVGGGIPHLHPNIISFNSHLSSIPVPLCRSFRHKHNHIRRFAPLSVVPPQSTAKPWSR